MGVARIAAREDYLESGAKGERVETFGVCVDIVVRLALLGVLFTPILTAALSTRLGF